MSEQSFCINHPSEPTNLRCNKCNAPICPRCAVSTPVGYRCKNCVRSQQTTFYTSTWYDYPLAAAASLAIGGLAQVILFFVPFLLLVIFAGVLVGGIVAEAVRLVNGKRRGQYTWLVVGACLVACSVPGLLWGLLSMDLVRVLVGGVYLVLAVGAANARLRIGK
ncbi:MAG: B-box zinc finger protein [Thermoflexales bacterium]|nr:B-box zinc finger protein [Thermoflexales bacterium]